jgi:biopolymer transport protein ExbD
MRRFSQRSHLVTVSEINITPLLDLAFVLLILFVITTPLLEQSISLKLPRGVGQPDQHIDKRNIRTGEISNTGV